MLLHFLTVDNQIIEGRNYSNKEEAIREGHIMCRNRGTLLDCLVTKIEPKPGQLAVRRQVGVRYYCGYWRKVYEVIATNGINVTVRWPGNQETTHCTSFDPQRDYCCIMI